MSTPAKEHPGLPKKRRTRRRKHGANIPDSPAVDVRRTWEWGGRQGPWASAERHHAARRQPNQALPARTCSPRADSPGPCRQADRTGNASGRKRRSGSGPRWKDLWRGQPCLLIQSLCRPVSLGVQVKTNYLPATCPRRPRYRSLDGVDTDVECVRGMILTERKQDTHRIQRWAFPTPSRRSA